MADIPSIDTPHKIAFEVLFDMQNIALGKNPYESLAGTIQGGIDGIENMKGYQNNPELVDLHTKLLQYQSDLRDGKIKLNLNDLPELGRVMSRNEDGIIKDIEKKLPAGNVLTVEALEDAMHRTKLYKLTQSTDPKNNYDQASVDIMIKAAAANEIVSLVYDANKANTSNVTAPAHVTNPQTKAAVAKN